MQNVSIKQDLFSPHSSVLLHGLPSSHCAGGLGVVSGSGGIISGFVGVDGYGH